MTDRRPHPARRARVVTGGLSAAATFAMVAAMGLPAGADASSTDVADGPAVGSASVPASATVGGSSRQVRVVVRRHHVVGDGQPTTRAGSVRSARTRAPAPAPATRRTTRSGGS